ncbi:hypothetical protein B0T14DRAFT_577022 [Immersiella caudata]|uniref:Uncharacterized protein n=1 Tax=Immersiella caudata TaxID=314043 RepID=A0AA39X2N6_9PEZI|nr:hypothetical protein B0T14DRAFT_577022 [Immersiella caudata]
MRFTPSLGQATAAILFLAAESQCLAENDVVSSQAPLTSESFFCKDPPFRAQLISTSPLLIYLQDFLTQQELQYLQKTSKTSLPSEPDSSEKTTHLSHRGNEVLQCIASRLHTFQGHRPPQINLEAPELFRRSPSSLSPDTKPKKDSASNSHKTPKTDTSTIHSTLHTWTFANQTTPGLKTTGGTLTFPLIPSPITPTEESNAAWCPPTHDPLTPRILDCDAPYSKGLTFLPVPGSAVYFLDSLPDGRYDRRTGHYTGEVTSGEVEGVVFRVGRRAWIEED